MIRTFLATGASALALALSAPAAAQEASAAEAAVPTMSFGTWGVDPEALSDTIRPGDDFFGYVNREWLDANPLPPQFSRFGAFTLLAEKSTSDVKALVDELVARDGSLSADEQRIVDAYKAFADTAPP